MIAKFGKLVEKIYQDTSIMFKSTKFNTTILRRKK